MKSPSENELDKYEEKDIEHYFKENLVKNFFYKMKD